MNKVLCSLVIATTILVTSNAADIEIIEAPTKVSVTKPKPYGVDMKSIKTNALSKTFYHGKHQSEDEKIINNKMNNTIKDYNNSSTHPEVKNWPKVFVLSNDPSYSVMCYSGISINISQSYNNHTSVSTQKEVKSNASNINMGLPKVFMLSSDPQFPVLCREAPIPANFTDFSKEEILESVNITCIRRDYEQNISAIFLYDVGPIKTAWNVFNNSISYGFNNVIINTESFGRIKILNETIVDCDEYGFQIDEKIIPHLSGGAAASLAG